LSESLKETKKKNIDFAENNNLNLFYGQVKMANEVIWNSDQDDLEKFLPQ
jgi:hypothetical protein